MKGRCKPQGGWDRLDLLSHHKLGFIIGYHTDLIIYTMNSVSLRKAIWHQRFTRVPRSNDQKNGHEITNAQ